MIAHRTSINRRTPFAMSLVFCVLILGAATLPAKAQTEWMSDYIDGQVLYEMPGIQQFITPTDGVPGMVEVDYFVALDNQEMGFLLHAAMPRITDGIVLMLRSMQVEDFQSSDAAVQLKRQIQRIIEGSAEGLFINDILFSGLHVY